MYKEAEHLILDFDGVIGDSWKALICAHLKSGNVRTRNEAITEMNNYFSKLPFHTKNHTLSEEEMREKTEWTIQLGQCMSECGIQLFEDFVTEIEKLKTKNIAIVSSGSQVYVKPTLEKTNIKPTHILTFENHHSKEEKIEIISKDWNVQVGDVYYITDSLSDVYELQNFIAKDKLIGVAWGFSGRDQLLQELNESFILNTPQELANILEYA